MDPLDQLLIYLVTKEKHQMQDSDCLLYTSRKYLAGHGGGVQQMGSQIEQNDLDLVIFLRDPEQPKQHEPDVHRIIRLCDVHSIPPVSYTHLDVYKRQPYCLVWFSLLCLPS